MTFRKFDRKGAEDYFEAFFDFFTYTATDWVITTVELGAGSATEAVDADAVGGVLVVTNDAADNDADSFQMSADGGTTPAEIFKFQSGKALQFKARLKLDDVTQSDLFVGLAITDTTPYAGVTDGVYFSKDDGDAYLDVSVTKDSTSTTQAAVHTMVDDTYVELEIWYDGGSKIHFYVDGVCVAGLATTNMPDDEELAITMQVINGEAAAKVLSVDYIGAKAER